MIHLRIVGSECYRNRQEIKGEINNTFFVFETDALFKKLGSVKYWTVTLGVWSLQACKDSLDRETMRDSEADQIKWTAVLKSVSLQNLQLDDIYQAKGINYTERQFRSFNVRRTERSPARAIHLKNVKATERWSCGWNWWPNSVTDIDTFPWNFCKGDEQFSKRVQNESWSTSQSTRCDQYSFLSTCFRTNSIENAKVRNVWKEVRILKRKFLSQRKSSTQNSQSFDSFLQIHHLSSSPSFSSFPRFPHFFTYSTLYSISFLFLHRSNFFAGK